MDSLRDWYRYVDRLSRPSRRLAGEEPEPVQASWRPWLKSEAASEEVAEAIHASDLPDLTASIGAHGLSEAIQPATRDFEDPTLYDELDPIPEVEVPDLRAPEFEVAVPRFSRFLQPEHPEASDCGPDEAASSIDGQEGDCRSPGLPEARPAAQAERRRELLVEIRSRGAAVSGQRSRSRESREELVQRLLDPTLTLEEAALFLGVCPTTVRRYTNRGQLRHFRTQGNQRRFRLSDVMEFLESRSSEIEADARADREAGLS